MLVLVSESTAQPLASVPPAKTMVTLTLTNNDSVYADIRNLSIEKLGSYMQEKVLIIEFVTRYTFSICTLMYVYEKQ